MSKHNYSQYSNKKHNNINVKTNAEETLAPVEVEEIKMVVEHSETAAEANTEHIVEPVIANETVETVALPATVTGTVTGCSKLNVRVKPAIDAEVVTVLNSDSKVEIDPARSTNDWLKITTSAGVEGYCMRKFVSAKL